MDCCRNKYSTAYYIAAGILFLLLVILAACGTPQSSLADKMNFTENDTEYRRKFTYPADEDEKPLRYWYHYVVSSIAGGYKVRIFHPDKKVLTEERVYSTPAMTLLHGPYKSYWDDGSIRELGTYQFGRKHGNWLESEPGKGKSSSGQYVNQKKEGLWTHLDTNGLVESVFTWHDGMLHGKFYEYDKAGQKINEGIYKSDTLLAVLHKREEVQTPYLRICLENHIADRYACSELQLRQKLFAVIRYPQKARQMGIEGVAVMQWDVMKDGTVSNLRMPQSLCAEIEAECRKAFSNMPEWVAARKDGTTVQWTMTLPLNFRL